MKMFITVGAATVAAALSFIGGGDGECATSTDASCCSAPATTASLASARVQPVFDPAETGSIVVTAKIEGDRPDDLAPLQLDGEKAKGCDAVHEVKLDNRERIISESGHIANVVVMVEAKGVDPIVSEEPYVLDQRGCRFEPHVLVVPVGGTVRFLNSDEVNHNVHSFAKKNTAVNKNVAGGASEEQMLEKDETIEVKCDIHPWMKSYVVVTEAARFGVTGKDGKYELQGLPPGDYKVSWWHESLGKGKSDDVTVAAGSAASLELGIGGEEKKSGRGRRRR